MPQLIFNSSNMKRTHADTGLVGATIAFTGYGRGRYPAAEFKLVKVIGGQRPRCLLQYNHAGAVKTYVDAIDAPSREHLLLRYRVILPSAMEAFVPAQWESRETMPDVDCALHFDLPAFQCAEPILKALARNAHDETFIDFALSAGLGSRLDAAHVVNIHVQGGPLRWTRQQPLILDYRTRKAKDTHMLAALAATGPKTGLRAGSLDLQPWQATAASRLRQLVSVENFISTTKLLIELETNGGVVQKMVTLETLTKQRAVLVRAATGQGKTFAALAGFRDCLVYAIVFPSACRQWVHEAERLGLSATWINSKERLRYSPLRGYSPSNLSPRNKSI
jgi:hypothetical protein